MMAPTVPAASMKPTATPRCSIGYMSATAARPNRAAPLPRPPTTAEANNPAVDPRRRLPKEVRELRWRDVRAAENERDVPAAQPVSQLECRRQGGRAGGLGEVAGGLDHQPHCSSQLGIGDQHEVVELLPEDALR